MKCRGAWHRLYQTISLALRQLTKTTMMTFLGPTTFRHLMTRGHFPELSPPLAWGWSRFGQKKRKVKEGWIWCKECQVFVPVSCMGLGRLGHGLEHRKLTI